MLIQLWAGSHEDLAEPMVVESDTNPGEATVDGLGVRYSPGREGAPPIRWEKLSEKSDAAKAFRAEQRNVELVVVTAAEPEIEGRRDGLE